jgi:hypothetical protein
MISSSKKTNLTAVSKYTTNSYKYNKNNSEYLIYYFSF